MVRDAQTGAPIPGAWVTWRLPPGRTVEAVLSDPDSAALGVGLISDADGRFLVPRLPADLEIASTLFAVARGYAYGAATPALRGEVVFELRPAASLTVLLAPFPPDGRAPELTLESTAVPRAVLDALPSWSDQPDRCGVACLPPGPYTLRLDGQVVTSLTLAAGESRQLTLRPPPRYSTAIAVEGPALPRGPCQLDLIDLTTGRRTEVVLDAQGSGQAGLPAGRYAAFLWDDMSMVRLRGVIEAGPDGAPARLEAPLAPPPTWFTIRGPDGPSRSGELGAICLDAPHTSLIHVQATGEPGRFAAALEPGRYGLFDGALWLGAVDVSGAPVDVARTSGAATVRWRLPDGLQDREQVRARLAVVPVPLASARPDLVEGFADLTATEVRIGAASRTWEVPLAAAGDYRLIGSTELGPLDVTIHLAPGGEAEVSLPPSR